jgi:hypothetical protein
MRKNLDLYDIEPVSPRGHLWEEPSRLRRASAWCLAVETTNKVLFLALGLQMGLAQTHVQALHSRYCVRDVAFLGNPVQNQLRVTVPSAAAAARIARQRLHDAIRVLRCERDLDGETLGRRDAQGTGNETDLARDEYAFVYLGGAKMIGDRRVNYSAFFRDREKQGSSGLTMIACEYGPMFAGAQ